MKKTALFRDSLFIDHDPGFGHVESPDRVRTLFTALEESGSMDSLWYPSFSFAPEETILLNHSKDLIDIVAATSGKMYTMLDGDTFTSPKSYDAARLAVGAVTAAVDLLAKGETDNCFTLVRPPGHHAEFDKSMGFCLFNNVAIAAHYALKNHDFEKIMIIDWDVHHGNGTQNAFYESEDVLFVSIHQSPLYPGTGQLQEVGEEQGTGYTVNIPLPGGQGDEEYANIFNTVITPIGQQFKPDLILVSGGFDAYWNDAISSMRLTHEGFGYMARKVMDLASEVCGGKLLVTLEGGYNLTGLKECVLAVLQEMTGERIETSYPSHLSVTRKEQLDQETTPHPAIEMVRGTIGAYWNI